MDIIIKKQLLFVEYILYKKYCHSLAEELEAEQKEHDLEQIFIYNCRTSWFIIM